MDDDEESFARLLSQSTAPSKPTWSSTPATDDPWANPFAESPTSSTHNNPFANTSSPFSPAAEDTLPQSAAPPAAAATIGSDFPRDSPTSPRFEDSPYVQQLEDDHRAGTAIGAPGPDPPSVIAARLGEQEHVAGFGSYQPYTAPYDSPTGPSGAVGAEYGNTDDSRTTPPATNRNLPSTLIDDDLLAANDPSSSLKKAFVKSSPAPKGTRKTTEEQPQAAQPYVFTPSKKATQTEPVAKKEVNGHDHTTTDASEAKGVEKVDSVANATKDPSTAPASIPLPSSADATPTTSRQPTPVPPPQRSATESTDKQSLTTPSSDRVSVSPLDAPSTEQDYGFKSLAIGASSSGSGSTLFNARDASSSRFGGRGWGAMDAENDGGLFGKGGPSVRVGDPWSEGNHGWGEPGLPSPLAGPSHISSSASDAHSEDNEEEKATSTTSSPVNGTPRKPAQPPKPTFQISVSDPTKVGDPVRGYTVYTVRTYTTSPHYSRANISVLRRFSDFLWLFDILTFNNPGVIVPPMPDKHPFGRFQDTFIETRRMALERCLNKITAHPVLQLDPDLRLFLESESFAVDSKNRTLATQEKEKSSGLLASWTGPKYIEQDDWFDSRRTFLDSMESQLRALSKSIEIASRQRLEVAHAMQEFATATSQLADSDLGAAMCAALGRLADMAAREKVTNEELATAEVVNLLNLSDEYVRFIGSVRLAFASRIKCYERWQNQEKEVVRVRNMMQKARQQGRMGDQANQSLQQVGEAERKSRDAHLEFDTVSRLVKAEFSRFERERVEEFKRIMEKHLDLQVKKQKELIGAWEEYHGMVLKMVQRAQGQGQQTTT